MYKILEAIIFIVFCGTISAILGLFSRFLKLFFKNKESIDKGFLMLFSILSIILISLKGIDILFEMVETFSVHGKFGWKIFYFLFMQIFLSLLVNFSTQIFALFSIIFNFCSGNVLMEDRFLIATGIPLFILNIYHTIPMASLIIAVIF